MNSFEEYLKPEIQMWIDNMKDDLNYDDEVDYTAEDLDKLDLNDIASTIADNDYITEFINNCIRDEIDRALEKRDE